MMLLAKIEKLNLKLISINSNSITLPDFKTYSKATVIKKVQKRLLVNTIEWVDAMFTSSQGTTKF